MRKAARWFALVALVFFPAQLWAAPPKSEKTEATASGAKKKKKTKKPKSPAAQAKRHTAAGTKAYKARKYETAIAELEQAYKLVPKASVLLMLGDSYFQLKDFLASYEAYDRALIDHAEDLKPTQKADAERVIRQLDALTSQIEVMVDEKDAVIYVDGKSLGKSPMKSPVRVSATKHRVRVTAGTFEPIEQDVEPKPGERLVVPVRFVPEGPAVTTTTQGPAKLKVTATPAEATIELDGRDVGTGSFEGDVPGGKHRLVVRAMGYESFVQELEIIPSEPTSRDVQLEKEGGGKPAPVASATSGVYLNVAAIGVIPVAGQVRQPVPEDGTGTTAMALGGGGMLRAGYSFGLLGVEIVGAGLFERHSEKKNIPGSGDPASAEYQEGDVARIENYGISSLGIFAGAGPRLTTPGDTFRFSFGVAGGLALRQFSLRRETGGAIQDSYKVGATSTAPGIATDVSLTIGSTPGVKFIVGAVGLIGFGGTVATKSGDPRVVPVEFNGQQFEATLPTPSMTVARGLQFFVGPQLGVQFGQ